MTTLGDLHYSLTGSFCTNMLRLVNTADLKIGLRIGKKTGFKIGFRTHVVVWTRAARSHDPNSAFPARALLPLKLPARIMMCTPLGECPNILKKRIVMCKPWGECASHGEKCKLQSECASHGVNVQAYPCCEFCPYCFSCSCCSALLSDRPYPLEEHYTGPQYSQSSLTGQVD